MPNITGYPPATLPYGATDTVLGTQGNATSLFLVSGFAEIAGSALAFDSVAAASAAAIPPATSAIQLNGFATPGDGGGAVYIHATAGAGPGKFQSADGQWWGLAEQPLNVKMFGAYGDIVHDDTAALQGAINTGNPMGFPGGIYLANNLSQTSNFQCFYALGRVRIIKNANGPLFTSSGNNVQLTGLGFSGDASTPVFTGDNVVMTGDSASLINCGSRWAAGRAAKLTGNQPQIIGQCDVFQTADQSATGYDIEMGLSGVSRLYGTIVGVSSTQRTGGILATDTGSLKILGSQFGKFSVLAGTSPGGVNGGIAIGNRILGNVTINVSGAVLTGNQFGSVAINLGVGTAGISIDTSNTFEIGSTLISNSNGADPLIRSVGAAGQPIFQYGDDVTFATMNVVPAAGGTPAAGAAFNFPNVKVQSGGQYYGRNAANNADLLMCGLQGAPDNAQFGHGTGAGYVVLAGGATVYLQAAGNVKLTATATAVSIGGSGDTLGFFGAAGAVKHAVPVTLGDVVSLLQAYGLC